MPRLRCLIGTSLDELVAIPVNSSQAHYISSDIFEGHIAVFVKFESPSGLRRRRSAEEKIEIESEAPSHEYFSRPERSGVTWSIQVQGRFLKEYTADDVLFGNTFDRPLHLPWGSSAALKFMHVIDPTLEHDLYADQPWALSPLISTMPYFHHTRISTDEDLGMLPFPAGASITDDTRHLVVPSDSPPSRSIEQSSKARRTRFAHPEKRQAITFGPNDLITTDFCYGFLKFPDLFLSLPAGVTFDLKKYWDGQPVRFVCCERHPEGFAQARTFWIVQFEIEESGSSGSESGSEASREDGY